MAEKRTIEVEIKSNSGNLKQQLREAQKEVEKLSELYGATSEQAIKAAKRAGELKDAIGDAKALTDAFNPDAKFNALSNSIGGVLNGFQAFEGALGLVGVEGEAVQETLLKVQSAMALSQGLQGLGEARDSFKQLGAVAKNALQGIKTGIAATGIGVFLVALGAVVAYWDDIKKAVSGVSAEQEKLNATSKANFEISKQELDTLDAQDNILKEQGKSEKEILAIKIKKIDAAITLGEIELENVKRTSKAEEDAAIRNYNLTKKITETVIKTALFLPKLIAIPIDLAIKGANKISEILGVGKAINFELGKSISDLEDKAAGFVAGSIFNVQEVRAKGKEEREAIEKELIELKNQKAGFNLSIKAIDKQEADARKQKLEQERKELINLNEQIQAEKTKLIKDEYEQQRAIAQNEASKRIEETKKIYATEAQKAELIKLINENLAKDLNAINEAQAQKELEILNEKNAKRIEIEDSQYALEQEIRAKRITDDPNSIEADKQALEIEQLAASYDAKFELALGNAELEKQLEESFQFEKDQIKKKYSDAELARIESERQARLNAVNEDLNTSSSALQSLQNLSDIFFSFKMKKLEKGSAEEEKQARRQFKFNKALQLGMAIIDGAKAITASLAQAPVAIGPAPNPAGIASLALAATSSALNIAKIASAQFQSSGGGGSSSAPSAGSIGGGGASPSFNVVGNSTANQLAQIETKPVQAFVVSGEVTSAQSLDRNRQLNATFG